ncbi:hypothetical protein ACVIGB_001084 [Bradyrhizobium sp. USDA 4341]
MGDVTQLSENEKLFLRALLQWEGVATTRDIKDAGGPTARQYCKRKGWVEFDRYYWRITEQGRAAYAATQVQTPSP